MNKNSWKLLYILTGALSFAQMKEKSLNLDYSTKTDESGNSLHIHDDENLKSENSAPEKVSDKKSDKGLNYSEEDEIYGVIKNNLDYREGNENIKNNKIIFRKNFINNFENELKKAENENNKMMNRSQLKLIQLMEQGDQTIKSRENSFQFGANYSYNDMNGTYKGQGDKADDVVFKRNETLKRNVYSQNSAKYGTTNIELNDGNMEKPVEIEIGAQKSAVPSVIPSVTPIPATPVITTAPAAPALSQVPSPLITTINPVNIQYNPVIYFGLNYESYFDLQDQSIMGNYDLITTGNNGADIFSVMYTGSTQNYTTDTSWTGVLTGIGRLNWMDHYKSTGDTNSDSTFNDRVNKYTFGAISNELQAVLTDSGNHSGTIKGKYDLTNNTDSPNSVVFAGLQPTQLNVDPSDSRIETWDFTGDLVLHNNNTGNAAMIGLMHQLVAGGGVYMPDSSTYGTGGSILKNSGNITLQDGKNMVGMMVVKVDAYGNQHPLSETRNDGNIYVNAEESIGMDYGELDAWSPKTKLFLGNIYVNGKNNYGFRMADHSTFYPTYYDETSVSGANGNGIYVSGANNVGAYVANGYSTGDPIQNVKNLKIHVDGVKNIGFLRSNNVTGSENPNPMVLDDSRLDTLEFLSGAQDSVLVRSDIHEVDLNKNITVGSTGPNNILMQATGSGIVKYGSGNTANLSADKFYGIVAGDFQSSGGAVAINEGTLNISGNQSIGMAIATGNTGKNAASGIISYTGLNGAAVYNQGTFMNEGTIKADGMQNFGIYNSSGTSTNSGRISVTNGATGMYATGSGSKIINNGIIELSGSNSVGMWADNNAVGENWGTITTVPNSSNNGIIGVVATNGGIIKNYGQIVIEGPTNYITYTDSASSFSNEVNPSTGQTGITSTEPITTPNPNPGTGMSGGTAASKYIAGVEIIIPKGSTMATATVNGVLTAPSAVDTNVKFPHPATVTVVSPNKVTEIVDLSKTGLGNIPTNEKVDNLGMYVDTSGVNYTHPINGLNLLTGLSKINLLFGTEAARYTKNKIIEVGNNIVDPYNSMISSLASSGGNTKFTLNSGSLTWIATATQNQSTGLLDKVYLAKIPYTVFAVKGDDDTYSFLDGLEQRYGVKGIGTGEKNLFDKLNNIGKGEPVLFAQAVDEMKGHQYGNIQQRINMTGNILDNEFKNLKNEWKTASKSSNKINVFGTRDKYKTDTAGIADYTNNAYGVTYLRENETVRLGNSSGWYAGAVNNNFKFKDLGGSRENQIMIKAGIFKTMTPENDYNGSLQWITSGDIFLGINEMKRKFFVVDDIFSAKSNYFSYGTDVKNELGYNIRLGEKASIKPYGALRLGYGRFSKIKENDGEMRLEVKGNDYYSIKPEMGIQFKFVQPLTATTNLSLGITTAYENELGKINHAGNKAKVRYTDADWFGIRSEIENRKGNGKFGLNLGLENSQFGITANLRYDTSGKNIKSGLGFRLIY